MEVTKELITWYVNEKAKIILEYNPYEALIILQNLYLVETIAIKKFLKK